ncbi:hypothetical protein [Vibrio echinoideorum]|uniref:hypothetical protein n=1 Tax=Vibrio echinoideorum TaxID=2100116 RepID=UPI00354C40A9
MTDKYYWPVDPSTKEVGEPVKAMYRGGIYHIPRTALQAKPVEGKIGFAVIAVINDDGIAAGSELVEDHRDKTMYDQSNCLKTQKVTEFGPILDSCTLEEPKTEFDEWTNNTWVTNESNKYIAEYNQVDNVRRGLYAQMCDPLIAEAQIKRLSGKKAEADISEALALAARAKIQAEHPWPTPPAN